MIKSVTYIIIVFCLSSCMRYFYSAKGKPRVQFEKLKIKNTDNTSSNIEMQCFYKHIFTLIDGVKYKNEDHKSNLFFFNSIKFGLLATGRDNITKDYCNAAYFKMGGYYTEKGKIKYRLVAWSSGVNCINEGSFIVKGDTIIKGDYYYLKDKTIPKEWMLGMKPDW